MMMPITPSNPPSSRPSAQLRFFDFAIATPMAAQNSQTNIQISTIVDASRLHCSWKRFQHSEGFDSL